MTLTYTNSNSHEETSAPGSTHPYEIDVEFATVLLANLLPAPTTSGTLKVPCSIKHATSNLIGQILPAATESTSQAIFEIRRRSGLTWEELGDLFNVSRRSIHHWANGKSPSISHEQVIRRMLTAIRRLDQSSQQRTRTYLLIVDESTKFSKFEMLKEGHFEEAVASVENTQAQANYSAPLSQDIWNARQPHSSILYLEAEQDRPETPGKARTIRPFRG